MVRFVGGDQIFHGFFVFLQVCERGDLLPPGRGAEDPAGGRHWCRLRPWLPPILRRSLQVQSFWYGSGSADLYLGLTDPESDPDPAILVSDFQDGNFLITF